MLKVNKWLKIRWVLVLCVMLVVLCLEGKTISYAEEAEEPNIINVESDDPALEEPNEEDSEESSLGSAADLASQEEEVDPEISVNSSISGGVLSVTISNNSEEDMKNTALLFDKDNRYSVFNEYHDLGTIKSGDSQTMEVRILNVGHGIIKNFCDMTGGVAFGLTFTLIVLAVVIAYCVRLYIRHKRGKKGKGSTVIFSIAGVMILLLATLVLLNKPTYEVLEEGQNYSRDLTTEYKEYDFICSLQYNQDIIEEKSTSEERPIDFEVQYEYDENKPVTDNTEILSEGKNGVELVTTTTIYRNGEVDDVKETSYVTEEPVTQIELQGTKSVVQIENIDANRVYIPDDTMYLGESKLDTSVEDAENNLGQKEVTYTWNKEENKIESTEEVTKEPGTNIWKAGVIVEEVDTIDPDITYIANEELAEGERNIIKQGRAGSVTSTYVTEINEDTGKQKKNAVLTYVSSEVVQPESGEVEVGVLRTEKVTTPREIEYTYDDERWDNYRLVTKAGQDTIENVTSIMVLDTETGEVTDKVKEEVSRETIQEGSIEEVTVGSKEPQWIEEIVMTDELEYNTVYQEDTTGILQGDEQRVIQTGERGSLYTTQMIACDEDGKRIEGYKPRVVSTDTVVKPVDEIILVAKGSPLVFESEEATSEDKEN